MIVSHHTELVGFNHSFIVFNESNIAPNLDSFTDRY